MADSSGCLACDVLSGAIPAPGGMIFENEHWVVDHSVSPVLLREFLIIKTKRHCESIAELTSGELASFAEILRLTTLALDIVLSPDRLYACSFGESVRHVHWYVIPRTVDMPANGIEVVSTMWDGRWACSDGEAADLARRVRDTIKSLIFS